MKSKGVRVYIDDRENYKPGWKFNHWEVKGIPLRLEIGKKDFENKEVKIVRRDNGDKMQMKWTDLSSEIPHLLEKIHVDMFERAKKIRDDHMKEADTWEEFMVQLNAKNLVFTPWCN